MYAHHLPFNFSTDLPPLEYMGDLASPGPSLCKLCCSQLLFFLTGAAPGVSRAPTIIPFQALVAFLAEHVSLKRRTVQLSAGGRRVNRHFVELGASSTGMCPALTLSAPPADPREWRAWYARQPTSRDDVFGVHLPGMRLNREKLLSIPDLPTDLATGLVWGYDFSWMGESPPRYAGDNYRSCADNLGPCGAEYDRLISMGFLEGPLDYVPHVVNSIGCIIKHEPYKVRNVLDCLRSDINSYMSKPECRLDMLDSVVPSLCRQAWLSKFDETDAFLGWPLAVEAREVLGIRHPVTGQYYRYAYMPFGPKQAPALQQRWAAVIRDGIINREGLRYCRPGSPEADPSSFRRVGAYLDDFLQQHGPALSSWQALLQWLSSQLVLQDYGIPVKVSKNELPARHSNWVGFSLDSTSGMLSVTPKRATKLAASVRDMLSVGSSPSAPSLSVPRLSLAALVGKLQHCCHVVPAGQSHLVELYRSRDEVVLPPGSSRPSAGRWSAKRWWALDVQCCLSPAALADLRWWLSRLTGPSAGLGVRVFWHNEAFGCLPSPSLFEGLTPQQAAEQAASLHWLVITSDASGHSGGAWFKDRSGACTVKHISFSDHSLPREIHTSSNLRELYTPVAAIDEWVGLRSVRGCRVLLLLDNQAAVGAINKRASMSALMNAFLQRLFSALDTAACMVVAVYLPGRLNVRADRLSRLSGQRDNSDWQLRPFLFRLATRLVGRFTVDACCDVLGQNSFCAGSFWCSLDPCTGHDWTGHQVWCNPPWELISDVLLHFRRVYHADGLGSTSALFVLPAWHTASWWRHLSGALVLGAFPPSSFLFTSPDWFRASKANPVPLERVARGLTRWPVLLAFFPRRLVGPHDGWRGFPRLPRLRGDSTTDFALLRRLWGHPMQFLQAGP